MPLVATPVPLAYNFPSAILREYDIRGKVGVDLSEKDAYYIGLSFGTFVRRRGGQTICVGYDGRLTSPGLVRNLIEGLMTVGLKVTDVGVGPSPYLYFNVKTLKTDAGIMVTGSHNPPEYNGFKMMLQNEPVFGQLIQDLGTIATNGDFEISPGGTHDKVERSAEYITRLVQDLIPDYRNLKVAWDAGNGAAGAMMKQLSEALPGEHILLYEEVDGNFPNHHPDPSVDANLQDLKRCVLDNGCDLGIAFDGDGDRIGVINEKGDILRCDTLMTLYARDVLESHPGAPIIGDVKCSQAMFDEINCLGGQAVVWKTGHSHVKAKLAELKAPLAGELSGHIFFADKYFGYDDGLYCAVRLLNIISKNGALSSLTAHLPALHSTPEIRIEVDAAEKFDLVPRVAKQLEAANDSDTSVNTIDGVRVSTQDGWWLLRPSNTQDVLVARAEASSAEGLDRLKSIVSGYIEDMGYNIDWNNPGGH